MTGGVISLSTVYLKLLQKKKLAWKKIPTKSPEFPAVDVQFANLPSHTETVIIFKKS